MLRPEGLTRSMHPPAVYGALLKDHYVMDTLHFHWGLRDYRGSEHRVNGVRQVDHDPSNIIRQIFTVQPQRKQSSLRAGVYNAEKNVFFILPTGLGIQWRCTSSTGNKVTDLSMKHWAIATGSQSLRFSSR